MPRRRPRDTYYESQHTTWHRFNVRQLAHFLCLDLSDTAKVGQSLAGLLPPTPESKIKRRRWTGPRGPAGPGPGRSTDDASPGPDIFGSGPLSQVIAVWNRALIAYDVEFDEVARETCVWYPETVWMLEYYT